jgi:AraC family transcriptional regulator, transcriptional activator of pobA
MDMDKTVQGKKNASIFEYDDGDIALIEDINSIKKGAKQKIPSDTIIMVFCISGEAKFDINNKREKVSTNDVLFITYNSPIDRAELSEDFNAKIIAFKYSSVYSVLYLSKHIWQSVFYITQNPIVHLEEKDMQIFARYYFIAETKIKSTKTVFHKEIMRSLLMCIICEFLMITQRTIPDKFFNEADIKQGDILLKRFMELLTSKKGSIRSVQDAANILNVSNKYLSVVIKNTCGKNALTIIHYYTIQEAIRLLRYSDKTIKQISNEMNFPSMSFFGKFFKQQTGVSPMKYRRQEWRKNEKHSPRKQPNNKQEE